MTKVQILTQGEGRTVLQEDGKAWPVEGMEDPQTLFTRRRLLDGDLIVAQEEPTATAEPETTAAAKSSKAKSTEGEK